jgi:hypothetical protein
MVFLVQYTSLIYMLQIYRVSALVNGYLSPRLLPECTQPRYRNLIPLILKTIKTPENDESEGEEGCFTENEHIFIVKNEKIK